AVAVAAPVGAAQEGGAEMLVQMIAAMLAATQAAAPSEPPSPPASPPHACTEPAHRQFDFWVGKWDVYPTGKDKLVAHSLIESVYNGCGIRENWMPLKGNGGGSLNIYLPKE